MKTTLIFISMVAALWGCGPSSTGNPLDRLYNSATLDQDDCDILQYAIDIGARDRVYEWLHAYCFDGFYREYLPTVEPVPTYRTLLEWAERRERLLWEGIQIELRDWEYSLYGDAEDSLLVAYRFCLHNRTSEAISRLDLSITPRGAGGGEIVYLASHLGDIGVDESFEMELGWPDIARDSGDWFHNVMEHDVGYLAVMMRIAFLSEDEVVDGFDGERNFGLDGYGLK